MREKRAVWIGGALALCASLLLARVHPFGDAGLYATKSAQSTLLDHTSVPEEVRAVLADKCAGCHSETTRAPFYGRFAPVSWLMERDIVRGRAAMNLSRWDSYTAAQQQTYAAKIVGEVKEDEMPLLQYRIIHWKAQITIQELRALSNWARATSALDTGAAGQGGSEGDASRGKELYEKRCTGCHSLTQNHEGPLLQGVYGRTSGTGAGFAYSAAVKKSQIVWDDGTLEKWLADPDTLIPGNNMDFLVARPQDRRDIIRYLRQVSGK